MKSACPIRYVLQSYNPLRVFVERTATNYALNDPYVYIFQQNTCM
jgi:hypothetical protein